MELYDFVKGAGAVAKAVPEHPPLYNLESSLNLVTMPSSDTEMLEDTGLGDLIDKLLLLNPDFTVVTELSDLGDENFEIRDYQRPPGYSATSRVHMGRLCVPVLNDSGATCCCITEE